MNDTSGLGLPHQDNDQLRHALTVHDVAEQLSAASVPRSERQIKRYCESGFLDAKKIPGPSGDQWFIAQAALPRLIGDLQQWQMQRVGQSESRPAVAERVIPKFNTTESTDMPGTGRPVPAASIRENIYSPDGDGSVTTGYVTQLEKRIDEKDDVIGLLKGQLVAKDQQITDLSTRFGNLSDRFADTQKLLGAMQRMFAPLLGQGDPYARTENTESTAAQSPQSTQSDPTAA